MKFHSVNEVPEETDLLAVAVHTDPLKDPLIRALDKKLDGWVTRQVSDEDFTGKVDQSTTVATRNGLPARYLTLVGTGSRASWDLARTRNAAATAARAARRMGARSLAFVPPPSRKSSRKASGSPSERVLELAVQGTLLGLYRFERYKGGNNKRPTLIEDVYLVTDRRLHSGKKSTAAERRASQNAINRGQVVAQAVCRARDLINEPAAQMTPTQMAAEARGVARKSGLTVKVLGPGECEKLGMGMYLAVARGSDEEPRLVHMTYRPNRASKGGKNSPKRRIALVGKGVTFDSGGYSLKPSASMEDMKIDMSGAAVVIAAMGALSDLKCPHEVHALAACTENMVSGRAYKLGDVLTAMDGTTVEINNTDAEGRLTLGDAITYAREKIRPDEIIDFATLTGACVVALGPHTAGFMSDHDDLATRWTAAARTAGEDMWRLPLSPRLRDQLKSNIADMRNTGERAGGAITAGLFLKHFVKDTPWLHNDIAGPASLARESHVAAKGGTGFAVATLLEYLAR